MSHVNTQLIDAVVARVTGLTTTGSRVSKERPEEYTIAETDEPHLVVTEEGDEITQAFPDAYERTVQFRVDVWVKQTGTYGDTLRQCAAEVEAALGTDVTVGGKVLRVFYRGAEVSVSADGDQPVATRRMRFEVPEVVTASNAPEVLL